MISSNCVANICSILYGMEYSYIIVNEECVYCNNGYQNDYVQCQYVENCKNVDTKIQCDEFFTETQFQCSSTSQPRITEAFGAGFHESKIAPSNDKVADDWRSHDDHGIFPYFSDAVFWPIVGGIILAIFVSIVIGIVLCCKRSKRKQVKGIEEPPIDDLQEPRSRNEKSKIVSNLNNIYQEIPSDSCAPPEISRDNKTAAVVYSDSCAPPKISYDNKTATVVYSDSCAPPKISYDNKTAAVVYSEVSRQPKQNVQEEDSSPVETRSTEETRSAPVETRSAPVETRSPDCDQYGARGNVDVTDIYLNGCELLNAGARR